MQHGINYIYGHRFSDNKLYTMKAYREYKFSKWQLVDACFSQITFQVQENYMQNDIMIN